jgi:hypothetical protein
VTEVVFRALPEVRALLPADWYREVAIAPLERAVVFRDGVPVAFLRPGVHRFWTVDASVTMTKLDVTKALPALVDASGSSGASQRPTCVGPKSPSPAGS